MEQLAMELGLSLTAFLLGRDGVRTELRFASPVKLGTGRYSCKVYAPALFSGEKDVIGTDPQESFDLAVVLIRSMLDDQRVVDDVGAAVAVFTDPRLRRSRTEVDDGRRETVGLILSIMEDGGKARLIFDDAMRDNLDDTRSWRSEGLYTWTDIEIGSIADATDEYFRLIGENVVFGLLALRKFQD